MHAGTLQSGLSQHASMAVGQDRCRLPASWMGLSLRKRKDMEGWGHLYLGFGKTGDKFGSQVVKSGVTRVIKRKGRTRIKLESDTFSFIAPSFFDY